MTIDDLYDHSAEWWHPASENFPPEYKKGVLGLTRERLKHFNELSELTWFFFKDPGATPELHTLLLSESGLDATKAIEFLEKVIAICNGSTFVENELHDSIYALCEPLETKPAVLFKLIRISIVGGKNAPGLFETMTMLGKETTLRRLNCAKQLLTTEIG